MFDTPVRKRLILLIGIVVLVIIAAGAYLGFHHLSHHTSSVPNGASFAIVADRLPLAGASLLKDGKIDALSIPEQGTATLVDVSQDNNFTYYLAGNPALSETNVYLLDHAHPEAGLQQLTHSATVKFSLTHGAETGAVAFATASSTTVKSHVVVWSPLTNEETDLGEGSEPTLLPGGFFVVMRRGGSLVAVEVKTGTAHTLLDIDPTAAFAVDPSTMTIAAYNPVTRSIQTYAIPTTVTASYLGSTAVSAAPAAIFFVNGKPVSATAANGLLKLSSGGAAVPIPASVPAHYHLVSYHD